jgi:hypothetical protein
LAVVLSLAACGGADSGRIVGRWVLDSVAVNGVFLDISPDLLAHADGGVAAWFEFDPAARFDGRGPCNDISGSYGFDGTRMTTANAFHTLSRCLSEGSSIDDFESLVFDSLDGADVHFSSDVRMQWQADNVTLTFRRES